MNMYCELLPVPAASCMQFAVTFLKEHAALWWQSVHAQVSTIAEGQRWDQFVAQLRTQFQPINNDQNARTHLDHLR